MKLKLTSIIPFFCALLLVHYLGFSQSIEETFWTAPNNDYYVELENQYSSNNAVVLYEYGKARFKDFDKDDDIVLDYHIKIKILDEEGLNLEVVEIPIYFQRDKSESISNISGVTFNMEGDRIIEYALDEKDIIENALDKHCKIISFRLPEVKIGSIIEYSYTIKSGFINNFFTWKFQRNIPIIYTSFQASIPENYLYKINEPYASYIQKYELDQTIRKSFATTRKYLKSEISQPDGPEPGYKQYYSQTTYEIKCDNHMWEAENVPPSFNGSYRDNKLEFEFINYNYPKVKESGSYLAYIECVGEKPVPYTWSALNEYLLNNKYFGKQLLKTDFIDKKVASIIPSENTQRSKLEAIVKYLEANFEWNGKYKLFFDENLKSTWKKMKGSSADLNLLLIAMLRSAGIESYPLLASSVQTIWTNTPSIKNFNLCQTLIIIENEYYYSDMTSLFSEDQKNNIPRTKNQCFVISESDPILIDKSGIKEFL